MEQSSTCKVCNEEDEVFLHVFLHCTKLTFFKAKYKRLFELLKEGQYENETDWNQTVMLGENKKFKNGKVINLLVMLMKGAIWERRVVAKREKFVMDIERFFKRKVTKLFKMLVLLFFKNLDKLNDNGTFIMFFTGMCVRFLRSLIGKCLMMSAELTEL